MKQSKTRDGMGQWQLWGPTHKWQKGSEWDFCSGCGAINTETVRAHILHLMTSEVLTLNQHRLQEPKGPQCSSAIAQTHTHRHGHHTTCLSFCTDKSAGRSTHSLKQKLSYRFQLLLGFILHPPDVLHSQLNPLVNPTEQLAVEVGKYPFFLL